MPKTPRTGVRLGLLGWKPLYTIDHVKTAQSAALVLRLNFWKTREGKMRPTPIIMMVVKDYPKQPYHKAKRAIISTVDFKNLAIATDTLYRDPNGIPRIRYSNNQKHPFLRFYKPSVWKKYQYRIPYPTLCEMCSKKIDFPMLYNALDRDESIADIENLGEILL